MRAVAAALALVGAFLLGGAGCRGSDSRHLQTLKDRACACKERECARAVGAALSKAVADTEVDEAGTKLAMEAAACLAALGE
jgi:hypothetical protein